MFFINVFNYINTRNILTSLLAVCFGTLAVFPVTDSARAVTTHFVFEGAGYTAGKDLSSPLGIFFDNNTNEIYVADTGNHQIVVYDNNGFPVYRFYHHVTVNDETKLGEPQNIAVDAKGRIFVTDATVPDLNVLDHNGRQIAAIAPPVADCVDYARFDGVAAGPDGRIYATVACNGTRFVAVIGDDLEVQKFLQLEKEVGGSSCTTNIDIDGSGQIYLTDPCADLMVQVYSPEGDFVWGFGRHDSGFENFSHPTDIAIMDSGEMWIVDTIRQVASCFTREGEFLSYVGGKGEHPGAFSYPVGLATDGENRLFVVERAGNRFQCFRIVASDPETANK